MIAFLFGLLVALASGSIEQGWKPSDHEAVDGHPVIASWSWPCPTYTSDPTDWCWFILESDGIDVGPYL